MTSAALNRSLVGILILSLFAAGCRTTSTDESPSGEATAAMREAAPATSDWPHWRGPDRTGRSPERGWSSEGQEVWRRSVGLGYSSPSVRGDRLWIQGHDVEGAQDVLYCLDTTTGDEVWRSEHPAKNLPNMHEGGTLTTPIVAGDRVFVLCRLGTLRAHDVSTGEVVWERDFEADLGVSIGPFGLPSSPLVLSDTLYVNAGPTLALDAANGETRWQTEDYGYSYGTPEPFRWQDRDCLAVFNAKGLTVLDRSDGEEIALHPWTSEYNVNSASPIVIGDRIFISTGYNEVGCALLRLTDSGLEPIWSNKKMRSKMNGCVLVDDHLYGFDAAILKCLDLDGEARWIERGLGTGTVIESDGRLIVLGEEGELVVAQVSTEAFEPLTRVKVFEEGVCWTTPVLAHGRLYLRSNKGELVCRDHRHAVSSLP
ncbi:MAG: PQQ-binding-like beta-propeller repeat protein [Planctomycetota bacterium]